MNKRGRDGFTIVELLIVIVVIGVLAAIVIVAYTGVNQRAYESRSMTELASVGAAIKAYGAVNGNYPPDQTRGTPVPEILPYLHGVWPTAPWPNSVYDYDEFTGSDGNEVSQMSIRFCPEGGPISACHFPNTSWAAGFDVNSSAYWCVAGKCRAHPTEADTYPGYCLNCSH